MENKLVFTTKCSKRVIIEVKEASKAFSENELKQSCFSEFTKENQVQWCKLHLNYEKLLQMNCKIV